MVYSACCRHAQAAFCLCEYGHGIEARTPASNGNISSRSGMWGNLVSPRPCPQEGLRAQPARRGVGKPGFPIPRPQEGLGGHSPHAGGLGNRVSPSLDRGRVWEGKALPGEPCYPLADAGRRPAHPGPDLREGLGGQSPPRNNLFSSRRCAARAARTAEPCLRELCQPKSSPRLP